jgi:hypothetical protein
VYAHELDMAIRGLTVELDHTVLRLGPMLEEMRTGRRQDQETGEERYSVEWAGYESYNDYLGDLGIEPRWAREIMQAAENARLATNLVRATIPLEIVQNETERRLTPLSLRRCRYQHAQTRHAWACTKTGDAGRGGKTD